MQGKLITDRAALFLGDAAHVGQVLGPNSIDAIVTDPPAGIGFMGREWDEDKGGRDEWIAWLSDVMRNAMHVLKPGGHALIWALPRTSHWTTTAVENAGFEIRDIVMHLFGTGFPKSFDVSKAIDSSLGATSLRQVIRPGAKSGAAPDANTYGSGLNVGFQPRELTLPASEAARAWHGWGTALKPAAEHWILARKPLEGTVAANVQTWGTGGLNIDACRIGEDVVGWGGGGRGAGDSGTWNADACGLRGGDARPAVGRWPANVTLDEHSAELLDAQSGVLTSGANPARRGPTKARSTYKDTFAGQASCTPARGENTGGASRFFYVAKPSKAERNTGCEHLPTRITNTELPPGTKGANSPRAGANRSGAAQNHHPTVKSIALMRWLCRLITPPGGAVLDLFAGSGSTGVAALAEGFEFIGVERDPDYAAIACARIRHALGDTMNHLEEEHPFSQ
ncbi:DNA methyltransferase [Stigmatella aurantiaca]|uniref:Methyltransferase n=1 Tax=Stigmatella aurantiaca (strain DW4/3-1) TaxID=378806 RepID=Q096J9_STIAD|nr:DNA methyltransferase [Stigmatella aurantiaca]ADO68714.1 Modification methylase [Stigmatella aurantiaca DW4/3-1]EAU67658.1 DNA methylase [Stigmatella aurantiaca DW4/3-1]